MTSWARRAGLWINVGVLSLWNSGTGTFVAIDCDFAKMSTPEREEEGIFVRRLAEGVASVGDRFGRGHANAGGVDYSCVRCGTFIGKKFLVNELNARYYRTLVPGEVSLCGFLSAHAWDHGSAGVPIGWSQLRGGGVVRSSFLTTRYPSATTNRTRASIPSARTRCARPCTTRCTNTRACRNSSTCFDRGQDRRHDDEIHQSRSTTRDLMFASHDSYTSVGLGADATDALVDLVREVDPDRRLLFGAKISGDLRRRLVVLRSRLFRRTPSTPSTPFADGTPPNIPSNVSYALGRRAPPMRPSERAK